MSREGSITGMGAGVPVGGRPLSGCGVGEGVAPPAVLAREMRWTAQPRSVEIIQDLLHAIVSAASVEAAGVDASVGHVVEPLVSRMADWPEAIRHWCVDRPPISHLRVHRSCPLCASEEATKLFDTYEGFSYVACRRCSLWYIPDYVPEVAWARYQAEDELIVAIHHKQFERTLAEGGYEPNRERFAGYLDWIEGLVGESLVGRTMLDYGALTANAVRVAADHGLQAEGVECSLRAVEATKRRFPATAIHHLPSGQALAQVLGDRMFDLATAWEALEHVPDPVAALRDLALHVRPGGWLAVTVPNVDSYVAVVMREHCFYAYGGVDHQGHLNLFSPATLSAALEEAGFEVMYWETEFATSWLDAISFALGRHDLVYCIENVAEGRLDQIQRPPIIERLAYAFGPTLTRIEAALRAGPMIKAIARRRGGVDGPDNSMGLRRSALDSAAIIGDLRTQIREREDSLTKVEVERIRLAEHLQGEVNLRDNLLRDLDEAHRRVESGLQADLILRDQLLNDAFTERLEGLRQLQDEVDKRDRLLQQLSDQRKSELSALQQRMVNLERHVDNQNHVITEASIRLSRREEAFIKEIELRDGLSARSERERAAHQAYCQGEINRRDELLRAYADERNHMVNGLQAEVERRDELLNEAAQERARVIVSMQEEVNRRDDLLRKTELRLKELQAQVISSETMASRPE